MPDISYRIADFPHFDSNKQLSSALTVSYSPPTLDDRGYVKNGGFFFSIRKGGGEKSSTFLSEMEAALLSARVQAALEMAAVTTISLAKNAPAPPPKPTHGVMEEPEAEF